MKEWVLDIVVGAVLVAVAAAALSWATEPEQWYAGMHTEGCDFSEDCGCYEKLLALEKEKARKLQEQKKQ